MVKLMIGKTQSQFSIVYTLVTDNSMTNSRENDKSCVIRGVDTCKEIFCELSLQRSEYSQTK